MESAFGIDHGEFSKAGAGAAVEAVNAATKPRGWVGPALAAGAKGIHPKNIGATWRGMGTGEKVATVGVSGAIGGAMGLQQRKKNLATTGRATGNGGLVGVVARKTGMGYAKQPGQY